MISTIFPFLVYLWGENTKFRISHIALLCSAAVWYQRLSAPTSGRRCTVYQPFLFLFFALLSTVFLIFIARVGVAVRLLPQILGTPFCSSLYFLSLWSPQKSRDQIYIYTWKERMNKRQTNIELWLLLFGAFFTTLFGMAGGIAGMTD